MSGDNTDCSINFIPRMKYEALINGYKHILKTIYSPKQYYERIKTCLGEYRPRKRRGAFHPRLYHVIAVIKSNMVSGYLGKKQELLLEADVVNIFPAPQQLPPAISLSVYGFHLRKVAEKHVSMPVASVAIAGETGEGSVN